MAVPQRRSTGERPPTLGEAGALYLEHVARFRQRKRSTVQDYQIILRRHLVPFYGYEPLQAIDRPSVESYQRLKLAEGLSPKTVTNQVRFLHGIFRYAVGQGWVASNPIAGVEHPGRAEGYGKRAFTLVELEALVSAVPQDELGELERVLYLTAAMTGLRRGELQALRWLDVDLNVGIVRVCQSYTRGQFSSPKSLHSIRAVPLPERVANALMTHHRNSGFRGDEDLVFAHPLTGRPYDGARLLKRFKAALRAAGLREARFHDLRHTFGTRMAAAGAPIRFIQEWMGHSDYRTTSIYARYAADPSQGAFYAQRAFAELSFDPGPAT